MRNTIHHRKWGTGSHPRIAVLGAPGSPFHTDISRHPLFTRTHFQQSPDPSASGTSQSRPADAIGGGAPSGGAGSPPAAASSTGADMRSEYPHAPSVYESSSGYAGHPAQGFPPGYPYAPSNPYAGYVPPPPPPRKNRTGLIMSIVLITVIVLAAGTAGLLYATGRLANSNANPLTQATSTPSGPTATPGPIVVFQDALTSQSVGWPNDPDCFLRDDGLHVSNATSCFVPAGSMTDVDVSVQAKQLSGSTLQPYGIGMRRASKGNFYQFAIDSNSKAIVLKCESGASSCTRLMDYTPNVAILGGLNTTNTLEVRAVGAQFNFLVNNVSVAQIVDTTFGTGITSLIAGDGIEVAFSNLKITRPR